MYSYTYDKETGGILLNSSPQAFSKEPRPVFSKELDIYGFNSYWNYEQNDDVPYMWAEANNYYYRGKLVAQIKGGTFFTKPEIIIIDEPEPDNKPLKKVDLDLMIKKNQVLMESLTASTIKDVFNTFSKYDDKVDIFHVSFSGGKDSVVTLDIVQRALPHNKFVVIFGDTGMELPETHQIVEYTIDYCKKNGIEFYVAKSHLTPSESWRMFGPPTSTIRWCCSVHKTAPQLLLLKDILGKNNFTEMAFVGVRADESVRRSGYDYVSYGTKHRGQFSCNPILYWNSAEVYLYIFANRDRLRLNEVYKRGNTRAGCLVCPMSTNRNDYLNYTCNPKQTKLLTDIIFELNCSEKDNTPEKISYVENNGWKARKNGRDLKIALTDYDESIIGKDLVITFKNCDDSWKQWLKTLGHILPTDNPNEIRILFKEEVRILRINNLENKYIKITASNDATTTNVLFLKNLRKILRKSHYCVACKVCQANCKFGNLLFDDNGKISISDNCIKCGQCLEIDTGCLVYKSLWLSKGLGNMDKKRTLDCYAAHGPKIEWFQEFVKLGDDFNKNNSLGSAQKPMFNRFLKDAGIIDEKCNRTNLGEMLINSELQDLSIWALMLVNLSYTPQVGWFVKSFEFNSLISRNEIISLLSTISGIKDSALKAIPPTLKRISSLPLGQLGFGTNDKASKELGGLSFYRTAWHDVDAKVILYSLYKFAEACGDYYQFTLTRLMDPTVESDGVSPIQIFGLDKDTMTSILKGLATNYPDYISVAFTLDLDNINLRHEKSSADVLGLF